jgi:hypothetical protein
MNRRRDNFSERDAVIAFGLVMRSLSVSLPRFKLELRVPGFYCFREPRFLFHHPADEALPQMDRRSGIICFAPAPRFRRRT